MDARGIPLGQTTIVPRCCHDWGWVGASEIGIDDKEGPAGGGYDGPDVGERVMRFCETDGARPGEAG